MSEPNALSGQKSNLSPTKQALFEKWMRGKFTDQGIPRRSQKNPAPLSFAQERLWFLDQLQPGQSLYNEPYAFHLQGSLNVTVLVQSLKEIVQRHEILRTNFIMVDGQPFQVIAPSLAFALPIVDLQLLPKDEQEAEVRNLVTDEQAQPFDLANDPLVRVTLLQLGEAQYVLLFTMHHIVCDQWSFGVIIQELVALYEAFSMGKISPLPELPIQYADFAIWQQQWLQREVREAQLSYWKQQLSSTPTILELPTDRPRPAVQTNRGATQSLILSKPLTEALQKLSQQEKVTLFMTLLAAFQTLLYRYTGQDDIVVGTTISGRNRSEVECLIGFFVNTLVMRTDLSGTPSFREILYRAREVALGAYANQDLPFEQLVEKLQPERNLSHTPLFQVMFQLQNTPTTTLDLPGLTLSPLEFDKETAKFDLTLSMVEKEQELLGILVYNTDLFDAATIHRMLGHFQTLLSSIVANPDQQISKLSIISEEERHQLLIEWNKTQVDYPQNQCIHQLFEAQVERSPDAIAVVYEDQQLTYCELNQRANQLAHHLRSLGVEPEVLVGICVERSVNMVIGLLGIFKAGGVYVSLDAVYPQERLAFILQDAQVPVLLTQQRLIENLPKHQTKIVCLDTNWESIAQENQENLISKCTNDNLAYIIYTSGSTGQPKGVLVTHANVVRLLAATESWYHFNQHDVLSLFHSIAFDFSVWELWAALLYGGKLVVVPYWLSRSPEDFYKLLLTQQVTVLNQTPSAFRQLVQAEESLGRANKLSLRLVIFGGEALELQILKPWFERHGDQFPQLVNMYGITETTVHVTYRPLTMADLEVAPGSVIGRPIPDLQIYLLDQYQQLVPIGVRGEMYVCGAGVARGYLNRPELTAQRFVPNFFSDKLNVRFYKSGDLARYLPNGDIEYLGRIDHQVKIRGFRIELGEIEAMLAQHPEVRETVVLAQDTQAGDKHLVVYVVPMNKHTPTTTELRNFLLKQLPEYMVPSVFVMLEALPLTSNGKINRQALPAPKNLRPELEIAYVMPQTELEQTIATIWQKALNVEKIGIHDNFFELGGHSLLIVKVHSQLREIFKSQISILEMFRYPNISSLAKYLSSLQKQTTSYSYKTDIQPETIEAGKAQQKKRLQKIKSITNSKEIKEL